MSVLVTTSPAPRIASAARAIATGGLVAGALDAIFAVIAYVFVLHAFSIIGVLQYIASGLLGTAAFSGGVLTAALGVGIHFFLAFLFAALYYAVSRYISALRVHPVSLGIAYGAAIWLFMDLIVLPHTGTPKSPFSAGLFMAFLFEHAAFVGLPIALAARRYAN